MGNRDKYDSAFKAVRGQVVTRDGGRCVKCGSALELEVHHIEGYANNEPEKLVTLCFFCHGIAPMGKQEFDEWMVFGKDGIDSIRERLAKNGLPRIKREHVIIFCKTLVDLKFDTSKGKLKAARERMRAVAGKCEGRHPYGHKPGEIEVLDKMREMIREGKKPDQIAQELNAAGIETRGTKHGKKPWHISTISKILIREGIIASNPKNPKKETSRRKIATAQMGGDNLKIGRKPYGYYQGEKEIVNKMKELYARGKNPEIIARELNNAGICTRYKNLWFHSTIAKILIREGAIKSKPRTENAQRKPVQPTDNGGVWVPVMMNGAELRQVENVEKIS